MRSVGEFPIAHRGGGAGLDVLQQDGAEESVVRLRPLAFIGESWLRGVYWNQSA